MTEFTESTPVAGTEKVTWPVSPSVTEMEPEEKEISASEVDGHGFDNTTSNEIFGVTFELAMVSDDCPESLMVIVVARVIVTVPALLAS